jgi:excinuclease ABC subunit A
VGTITEVHDYLRVLWARIGRQHCHRCGRPVERLSAAEIADRLRAQPKGARFLLLARLVDNRKGEHRDVLAGAVAEGFGRFRIDGAIVRGDELPALDKKKKHTIDVVVDRLVAPEAADAGFATRLADSVETALKKGQGLLIADFGGGDERLYSEQLHCHACDVGFPELSPQSFSFNSPLGMCPDCNGLGTKPEMDPQLVVPDPTKSVAEGAIAPYAGVIGKSESWTGSLVHNLARTYKIDFTKPWQELPKKHRDLLLYGTGGERIAHSVKFATGKIEFERAFEGVLNELYRRFRQTKSEGMRRWYMQYLSEAECKTCGGRRLRPESCAVKLAERSLPEVAASTIEETRAWLRGRARGPSEKE